MKAYIVDWSSVRNIDKGTVVVTAKSISEAQDKFLDWLRDQPVYQHMWNLTFSIEEGELV
jgi:acylphosphatase